MTGAQTVATATERLTAAGIAADEARVEARLLAQKALGWTREQWFLRQAEPLAEADRAVFDALLSRRAAREPLAYLLGERNFYGLTFTVTPAVLIPRPETELLVEVALRHLRETAGTKRVADIGTGSGCLAIALAKHCPETVVHATDLSAAALAIARENAARHDLPLLAFFPGDLLDALPPGPRYQAIVSNPPYIAPDLAPALAPEVREWEPAGALFTPDADGLTFYRRLAAQAPARLATGGLLAVEVGAGQAEAVAALWGQAGLAQIETLPDLAGIPRVVAGRKPDGEREL